MKPITQEQITRLQLLIYNYINSNGQAPQTTDTSKLWADVEKSQRPYRVLNAHNLQSAVWLTPFSNSKHRTLYRQSYVAAKQHKTPDPNAILCASYTGVSSDFQAPIYKETGTFPIALRFKRKGSDEVVELNKPNLNNCQRCHYAKLGTAAFIESNMGYGAACQERRMIPCINWQKLVEQHQFEFVLVSAPPTSVETSAQAFHEIEQQFGASAVPYHYVIEFRKTTQKTGLYEAVSGIESQLIGVMPEALHTAFAELSQYMAGKFVHHGQIGHDEPLELIAPVPKAA